jgi:hypothetical protein
MRHLGSIVVSLLLGPVIYVLAGIGLMKMPNGQSSLSGTHVAASSIGLAAVLGAGLLYAMLVMARLSPLGPLLVGLGYLGATGWVVANRPTFVRAMPVDVLGVRGAALAPAGALTALLAVPLLATILSARRWRRRPTPTAYYPPRSEPDTAAPLYSAAPIYPTPMSPAPAPNYPAPTHQGYPPRTSRVPAQGAPAGAESVHTDSGETSVQPASATPNYTAPARSQTASAAPASGATPVWPVREDPVDPETTRKLP